MASVSFLARTLARQSFGSALRMSSKVGTVRFSSYFTPGMTSPCICVRNERGSVAVHSLNLIEVHYFTRHISSRVY